MTSATGPNLVRSGLVFNIDTFRYENFNIGTKVWSTTGLDTNLVGTINGTPSWSTSTGLLTFAASGDYLSWSANSAWAFGTGDFTIEVWIYPTSFSTYTHMVALPDQNTFALKANVTDGAIYFYSTTFNTYPTAGWTLTLNQWNHVTFRRQSGVAYMDLNGINLGTKASFTNNFTSQTLNIHNGWPGEFASGSIRQVRIYNRFLSNEEIFQNYTAFKNRTYEPVSFTALTTTQAIASRSITVNTTDNGFTPVTASGGYGSITYSLSPSLPSGMTLSTASGVIFGTPTTLLSSTTYTVTAIDAIGQTSSKTFSLSVIPVPLTTSLDIPTISNYPNIGFNVKPVSASGGFGTLTYSISPALPGTMIINASTGIITGSYGTTVTQNHTVTVTDQTTPTAQTSSKTFSLQITTPPALTTTLVTSSYTFNVGQQITPSAPVTASGGVVPYTYSVSPALPSGITLNSSTGVISGAPTAGQAATNYTITVTDTALQTSSKTTSITVNTYTSAVPTTNLYAHWDFSKTTDAVATSYTTSGVAFSGGISGLNFGAVSTTPSMTYLAGSTSHPMTVQETATGRKYIRFTTVSPAATYPTQGQGSRLQSGGDAFPNITSSAVGYSMFAAFRVITSSGGSWNRPHRLRLEGYSNDYNGFIWFWNSTSGNDLNILNYASVNITHQPSLANSRAIQSTNIYVECISVAGTAVTMTYFNGTGYTYYTGTIGAATYGTQVNANRTYEIRDNFYWAGGPSLDYYEGGVYSVALTQAEQLAVCQGLRNKWTT